MTEEDWKAAAQKAASEGAELSAALRTMGHGEGEHVRCLACDALASTSLGKGWLPPEAAEAAKGLAKALEQTMRAAEGFMAAVRDDTETPYPWAPWDHESEAARAALSLWQKVSGSRSERG